ncbi:HD domain-containing protein [Desulforhopalus vacuolatus]|uniref:HD-GYP domain-containing protein n=1 Tax=Desulforhopalus vacuolatus TaxID=40414 RepID=UPI001963C03A|nr:HD domain-containing phosphohydrolase [Desulforhopalus vacuolatus]MBM9520366.1 HD domain-containing protein [Desulforhopalus vacuolatus]
MESRSQVKKVREVELSSCLAGHSDLKQKAHQIRVDLTTTFPFVHRLAIAIYHVERDVLQTYVYDEDKDTDIHNYEAILSNCTSLKELVVEQRERIINDISILDNSKHYHTELIRQAGYLSSVSIPLIINGQLLGFLFANSRKKNVFNEEIVQRLRLISMIFALLLQYNSEKLNVLKSTVESMKIVSFGRDPETAEHQQRMAIYSLIIARGVALKYQLTDIDINYIYLYAPLHDIGKLTIADNILLKRGHLTKKEIATMQGHASRGDELAKKLINAYNLVDVPHISMLNEIIRWHHEKMDGSGYPDGLKQDQIPISVRIVSVADVFDALTSERPYKKAWTNEKAFNELRKLSEKKLDRDCVNVLINEESKVVNIQKEFKDRDVHW